MKIKRIVFTPLLEGGKPAVRPPTKGEWFQFPDGETGVEHSGHAHVPYPILVRTEEEVELPDPPTVYEWVANATALKISEGWSEKSYREVAEMISRHAAKVSPERLLDLLACSEVRLGDAVAVEAMRLQAAWRKK